MNQIKMTTSTRVGNNLGCLICGKSVYFCQNSSVKKSRKEICLKFTALVSRFLNLKSTRKNKKFSSSTSNFTSNSEIFSGSENKNVRKNTTSSSSSVCCSACLLSIQSFCDIYENWERLQLEMFHIVDKMQILMVTVPLSSSKDFQKEFVSKAQTKRRKRCPFIRIRQLGNHHDDSENSRNTKTSPQPVDATSICCSNIKINTATAITDYDDDVESLINFPSPIDHTEEFEDNVDPLPKDDPVDIAGANSDHLNMAPMAELKFHNFEDIKVLGLGEQKLQTNPSNEKEKENPEGRTYRKPRKPRKLKPRDCLICGKIFSSHTDLVIHLRVHIQEKPFICRFCGREYASQRHQRQHQRRHHCVPPGGFKSKSKQCEICGKVVLNIHSHRYKVHKTNFKPLICDICGKVFGHSYKLNAHMVCHTEEKNHACEICGRRFKRSAEVSRHKKTAHKEPVPVFGPLDQQLFNAVHAEEAVLGLPTVMLNTDHHVAF